MPDPWTSSWAEAEATAPAGVKQYDTLELRHPAFADSAGPFALRIVNGTDDQVLTLEAGAPLNGGEAVTFTAVAFRAERPEIAEGRIPSSRITIDNVARGLLPYLEAAVAYRADLVVCFRQYRSDDTSEPAYGPIEFLLRNVRVSNGSITGTATLQNLANKRFPGRVCTIEQFPGLLVQ